MVVLAWLAGLVHVAVLAEEDLNIIPRPASFKRGEGAFEMNRQTAIVVEDNSPELMRLGRWLRDALRVQNGLRLKVEAGKSARASGGVRLGINAPLAGWGAEAYELVVSPGQVTIRADEPAGVFYGVQTLLQMSSPLLAADPSAPLPREIHLPAVRIVDRPRFAWRGLLLDCSRTFLPLDQLKKYVDVCSFYKLNVLNLHLTDDQGWRLEIRTHPSLTKVGSKFDPRFPGERNGYYPQKQIKELVKYAAERHVTLVPEVEMPAHSLALLKSCPELSCRGGADEYVIAPFMFMTDSSPNKQPQTPHGVLCPGNERTFQVLEDILAEVIELFPSEYIHIGGDECSKSFWKTCPKCQARMKAEGLKSEDELQSYFMRRVAKMVQTRGRIPMGWDEVLEGGLAPGLAVMSWRSFDAGIAAAKQGHRVVMASKSHVYFDYGYHRTPASLVYDFDPIPSELDTPELRPLVLGGEACMWTHLARSEEGIDRSIFPRGLALAETLWTPVERKDWDGFSGRLERHELVLESKGVACFEWNEGLGLPNLTCGQDGRLWLVNAVGEIFLRERDHWDRFPGRARQVTSTPDGAIWSVSTQPAKRGFALAKWSEAENKWQPVGKGMAAVQISAAPDNSLWAAANDYGVFRYAAGQWANVIGLAREVSVGPDGTAWILTLDPARGGFELFFAPPGGRFRRAQPQGAGVHLAAGGPGEVWTLREDRSLRHLRGDHHHHLPGPLLSVTANHDGRVWGLTASGDGAPINVLEWASRSWKTMSSVP